jgi:hypothetical protein
MEFEEMKAFWLSLKSHLQKSSDDYSISESRYVHQLQAQK